MKILKIVAHNWFHVCESYCRKLFFKQRRRGDRLLPLWSRNKSLDEDDFVDIDCLLELEDGILVVSVSVVVLCESFESIQSDCE